ncbi:MAG: hypothetical protein WC455_12345 [Dehalococcoidia bacterium]|jgi:hypothetical protein
MSMSDDKQDPVVGKIEQLTEQPMIGIDPGKKPPTLIVLPHDYCAYCGQTPVPIPQPVISAALLAERCKKAVPEKMTVNEAREEIEQIFQHRRNNLSWCQEIDKKLWGRIKSLQMLIASAPLSDTLRDAKKDAQAESEADHA